MGYPVAEIECDADGVEVTLVEGEEVFILVFDALDGVCLAFGEVPDVTEVEGFDLVFALLVDGGDDDGALIDETPFSLETVSAWSTKVV